MHEGGEFFLESNHAVAQASERQAQKGRQQVVSVGRGVHALSLRVGTYPIYAVRPAAHHKRGNRTTFDHRKSPRLRVSVVCRRAPSGRRGTAGLYRDAIDSLGSFAGVQTGLKGLAERVPRQRGGGGQGEGECPYPLLNFRPPSNLARHL